MVARVIRRIDELRAVPLDKPVTITAQDLNDSNANFMTVDSSGQLVDPITKQPFDAATLARIDAQATAEIAARSELEPKPAPRESAPRRQEDRGTHGTTADELQRRLQLLEQSETEARNAAYAATSEAATARQEAQQLRQVAEQAQADTVMIAHDNAVRELSNAQSAYETAFAAGDGPAMAKAQVAIAEAAARKVETERQTLAVKQRQPATTTGAVRPAAPPAPASLEARVNAMQGLVPEEKGFLLQHPELVTDQVKNIKLQAAWLEAKEQFGEAARGTPKFMEHISSRLGYGSAPTQRTESVTTEDNTRRPQTSAPVSRDNISQTNGRATQDQGSITLSAEERDMARRLNLSDIEYARNKQRMNEYKSAGMLQQQY